MFHGITPEFNHPPCPDWALFPLKTYQITAQKSTAQIVPGIDTQVFAYNGSVPGPTIVARFREPVVVRQFSTLNVEMSVHLHGGHQPANLAADDEAVVFMKFRTFTGPFVMHCHMKWKISSFSVRKARRQRV